MLKCNRLQRLNPAFAASGHGAVAFANRHADRDKVRVSLETHVDALVRPELVESRIQVKIGANRNVARQLNIVQHARNVDEQIGPPRRLDDFLIRKADREVRTSLEERRLTSQSEVRYDLAEIMCIC